MKQANAQAVLQARDRVTERDAETPSSLAAARKLRWLATATTPFSSDKTPRLDCLILLMSASQIMALI
jgi:hypothetical protein